MGLLDGKPRVCCLPAPGRSKRRKPTTCRVFVTLRNWMFLLDVFFVLCFYTQTKRWIPASRDPAKKKRKKSNPPTISHSPCPRLARDSLATRWRLLALDKGLEVSAALRQPRHLRRAQEAAGHCRASWLACHEKKEAPVSCLNWPLAMGQKPGYPPVNIPIPAEMD